MAETDSTSITDALRQFGGRKKTHNIYSDNASELILSASTLGVEHHTSLSGEPKTNSVIERTNQIVVGGTTALLSVAGLPPFYWSCEAPRCCTSYNVRGYTMSRHGAGFADRSSLENLFCSAVWHFTSHPTILVALSAHGRQNQMKASLLDTICELCTDLVWDLETLKNSDLRASAPRKPGSENR